MNKMLKLRKFNTSPELGKKIVVDFNYAFAFCFLV